MRFHEKLFICFVIASACVIIIRNAEGLNFLPDDYRWIFLLLVVLTIISQFVEIQKPLYNSYANSLVFVFAGLVLLRPTHFFVLAALPEAFWCFRELLSGKRDYKNMLVHLLRFSSQVIAGIFCITLYALLMVDLSPLNPMATAIAMMIAAIFTLLYHLILGQSVVFAHKVSWKFTGLISIDNLLSDYVVSVVGFLIALLLKLGPWLIIPLLLSSYLIIRSMAFPVLKQEASTDSKTGLWNYRYFRNALENELARSYRFNKPLTVVMADIDLLRNINNTYGHLAGDAVITGIAQVMKRWLREYDVVARFGGEEYAILMPEIDPGDAFPRIDAIREEIERTDFIATGMLAPCRVTMSFGISGNIYPNQTVDDILDKADKALYQSKASGRNRSTLLRYDEGAGLPVKSHLKP